MNIDMLVEALGDSDNEELSKLRQDLYLTGQQCVPNLSKALQHSKQKIAIEATIVLGMMPKHALFALPNIFANSSSLNVGLRRVTMATIGRIGKKPLESLPILAKALADDDNQVRQFAAAATGMFGAASVTIVDELIEALHDCDATVRHFAIGSLLEITPLPDRVLLQLQRALVCDDVSVQQGVRKLIRHLGSKNYQLPKYDVKLFQADLRKSC